MLPQDSLLGDVAAQGRQVEGSQLPFPFREKGHALNVAALSSAHWIQRRERAAHILTGNPSQLPQTQCACVPVSGFSRFPRRGSDPFFLSTMTLRLKLRRKSILASHPGNYPNATQPLAGWDCAVGSNPSP